MGASYLSQILLDRADEAPQVDFDAVVDALPRTSAALDKRVRLELKQQLGLQVRYSFSLVAEFRAQLATHGGPARLAYLLRAILQVTRATFSIATMALVVDKTAASERALCLSDLALLLQGLRGEVLPTVHDLEHGMDALIIHLVQLTQTAEPADSAHLDRDARALQRR